MTRGRALLALRVLSGGVFVAFGVGKFVNHASELASFKSYGLPVPGLFVIAIGVIEIVGGALLISGRVLRADCVGARGRHDRRDRRLRCRERGDHQPDARARAVGRDDRSLRAGVRPSVLSERPGLR